MRQEVDILALSGRARVLKDGHVEEWRRRKLATTCHTRSAFEGLITLLKSVDLHSVPSPPKILVSTSYFLTQPDDASGIKTGSLRKDALLVLPRTFADHLIPESVGANVKRCRSVDKSCPKKRKRRADLPMAHSRESSNLV